MKRRSYYIIKHPVNRRISGKRTFGKAGMRTTRIIAGYVVVCYYDEGSN